jgi:DNA polymerase III subunit epsilon
MKYAIIDIETTGLNPKRDRITEVAILVHDGEKVTREFISLVNPEMRIPYRIRELTGISDSMVAMAPRFCEIAKEIVKVTEECVFVAHNVNFDYGFIREEFLRLGYNYERNLLCTKKLSRKLMPDIKGFSLGNLCKILDIRIEHRHRAFGDARATVKLFEQLLMLEQHPESMSVRGIRSHVPDATLRKLPEKPGVYYLRNEEGSIIYIGKSISIRDRVLSHLSSEATKKASEMRDQVYDVDYELCGSELVALLLESEEVKKHTPRFNRQLRRTILQWGLYRDFDKSGYITLEIRRNNSVEAPLTSFTSKKSATEFLGNLADRFDLCRKLCCLYKTRGACFHHQIGQCRGACTGLEPVEEYNLRVKEAIEPYTFLHDSFVVLDSGRNKDEKSVVMVENRRYCGFGYVPVHEAILDPRHLRQFVKPKTDHRDAQQIIKSYLKQGKGERVIRIERDRSYEL